MYVDQLERQLTVGLEREGAAHLDLAGACAANVAAAVGHRAECLFKVLLCKSGIVGGGAALLDLLEGSVIGVVDAIFIVADVLGADEVGQHILGVVGVVELRNGHAVERVIEREAEVLVLHEGVELAVGAFEVREEPEIDGGLVAQRHILSPFGVLHVMLDLIAREGSAGQLAALEHFDRGGAVGDLLENDLFHADLVGIVVVFILDHDKFFVALPALENVSAAVKELVGGGAELGTALVGELLVVGQEDLSDEEGFKIRHGRGQRVLDGVLVERLDADGVIELCFQLFARAFGLFARRQVGVIKVNERVVIFAEAGDYALDDGHVALGFLMVGNKAHAVYKVLRGDGRDLCALAVVPLGVLAQVERPDGVIVVVLPAFSERGNEGAKAVGLDQTVDDVGNDLLARGVGQVEGNEGGDVGRISAKILCGIHALGTAAAQTGDRQKHCECDGHCTG